MNICTSCFHAQVKLRKPNQHLSCTSKQNVKNHHKHCPDYLHKDSKYCRDYLNKESFIERDENNQKEFERYKELG